MSSHRALLLLCLICGCWAFGFGLECPLASRWLEIAGHSEGFIGLNTGTHFFGVIVAGLAAPALMRRYGRGCIAIGLLLSGAAVAAFPWSRAVGGLFVLRFVAGAGGALAMVPLESLVNLSAPPEGRARAFGWYATAVGIGFALGSGVGLAVFEVAPQFSFLLGGITLLGLLMVPRLPQVAAEAHAPDRGVSFRPPFLSMGSAWTQGFLEAGMLALLPLYLSSLGIGDTEVGALIGVILVGVIGFQLPIAWLADHFGRERMLLACFALVAVGLAVIPHLGRGFTLSAWLFVVGVCSGALYPLGLALLGERLPAVEIPRANAWYLSVNCGGCLVSPVVSGPVMTWWGRAGMFYVGLFVVISVVALWALVTLRRPPASADRPPARATGRGVPSARRSARRSPRASGWR
jgi:MFS family permease